MDVLTEAIIWIVALFGLGAGAYLLGAELERQERRRDRELDRILKAGPYEPLRDYPDDVDARRVALVYYMEHPGMRKLVEGLRRVGEIERQITDRLRTAAPETIAADVNDAMRRLTDAR